MPEVYYDSDNQKIILVADGFANHYDVDIISRTTMLPAGFYIRQAVCLSLVSFLEVVAVGCAVCGRLGEGDVTRRGGGDREVVVGF